MSFGSARTEIPAARSSATVSSTSSTYTKITTGELPSGVGARLASVGHSLSIMIMAGPIVINACAALPSGPGRRLISTALNVRVQNSISAAGSRQTSLGMTTDELSGMPFTLLATFSSINQSIGDSSDLFAVDLLWSVELITPVEGIELRIAVAPGTRQIQHGALCQMRAQGGGIEQRQRQGLQTGLQCRRRCICVRTFAGSEIYELALPLTSNNL